MDDEEVINIPEFRIEDIPYSFTFIAIGPPGSGKTTFIENLMWFHKHRYPVGRFFMGTLTGYERFCEITHPLYVSPVYSEDAEKKHCVRQQMCISENGKSYVGNYAINIVDDAGDKEMFHSKLCEKLFRLGSQHWAQMFGIGHQYAIDFPPIIRESLSYVVLFRMVDDISLKKLYTNFGGIVGKYEKFVECMKQITGDYNCMIIKKRSQSNNLEDCVSYFKTVDLSQKKWKFGCKEYHDWAKERYNPDYIEDNFTV